jgi:hypothetical protein
MNRDAGMKILTPSNGSIISGKSVFKLCFGSFDASLIENFTALD